MNRKTLIILILGLIITASLPIFSITSYADDYTLLTPLAGLTEVPRNQALQVYIPFVFRLLIGLAAAFTVLSIVIGGFQYISTDAFQKKSEGKNRIMNSIYGLVLVIGAWLILNTINPNLLKINLNIDSAITEEMPGSSGSLSPGGSGVATGADLLSGASLAADTAIRQQLISADIEINNPPCTTERTSNCTNLNGIPQSTIVALQTLKLNCTNYYGPYDESVCPIVVTAGTETSLHSVGTQHAPGNGVIDLRATSELNTYLGFTTAPQNGNEVYKDGFKFKFEVVGANGVSTGDHWHVVTQ